MRKVLHGLLSGIASITTTLVIMAAPVAAVVYSAEGVNSQTAGLGKLSYIASPVKQVSEPIRYSVDETMYAAKTKPLVTSEQQETIEFPQ
ncbi:MAG: hypothetical protein H6Q75_550 [Firmicutes bacterium]|nr:hypothetical protein [Bacillota bacterium]